MSNKYPRTYHLPWSPGKSDDDKVIDTVDYLLNTPLVVCEKIDGGNCCLNRENIFARTHASTPNHPSFNIGKAIHASIKSQLIDGFDYFGEYCYAKHSIAYSELPGWFLLFGIRMNSIENSKVGLWKSWATVKNEAERLGIPTVPELEKIQVSSAKELQKEVEKHMGFPSCYGGEREGVVVRRVEGFSDNSFDKAIAKNVRAQHVKTGAVHWASQEITPNKLK
jgi:hypothetical protein